MQNNQNPFKRFKIPPDFQYCQLHAEAALAYPKGVTDDAQLCPCCNRYKKQNKIPICTSTQELSNMGQQIPLFFYFLKATCFFLIVMVIIKGGDYIYCSKCQYVYSSVIIPQYGKLQIFSGYLQTNELANFIQFCLFVLSIIILKIFIKMRKYKIKTKTQKRISNRTIKLVNVHKKATQEQVKEALQPYQVDVIFTYRVSQHQECLNNINRIIKKIKMKKNSQGSHIEQSLKELFEQLQVYKKDLKKIKGEIKNQKNRLSIVFVIFKSIAQKQDAYQVFKMSLCSRLFYKCCTCCSDNSIRGMHFTVKEADQPKDIIWHNMQNPYLRTKFKRILSIFMCVVLLIFGITSEYFLTNFTDTQQLVGALIRTGITLLVNWIILTLLQSTTQNIESHQSITDRHLSLMSKLSFFLFVNISLSPLMIYYYNIETTNENIPFSQFLSQFAFSTILIGIGNISKPLPAWLSFQRVSKFLAFRNAKNNKQKCMLTQIEANIKFQPIQFPISIFYSLSLSSLLMCIFYINFLQILIVVQFIALIITFIIAKWMLLRVCKSPEGLARRMNNLAQSLLRFFILIYWIGRTLTYYLIFVNRNQYSFPSYLIRNIYCFIEMGIVLVTVLFSQLLVSRISKFIRGKRDELNDQQDSLETNTLILQSEQDQFQDLQNTYNNANLQKKLQDQILSFQVSQILA